MLPARADLTVPASWRSRRLRVPDALDLHFAELPPEQHTWMGHVPVTTPARTIRDCRAAHLSPELLEQAIEQGVARGLRRAEG